MLAAAALLAAVTPGALKLHLRTDGNALVPEEAEAIRQDRAVRRLFDLHDPFVVLIRSPHPDGIFNSRTMQLIRELTASLQAMPAVGATGVTSLATEPNFHHRPNSLQFQTFLEPPLETPAELAALRNDLRIVGIYNGRLVSNDGKAATLLVEAPTGRDRIELYKNIRALLDGRRSEDQLDLIGAPVAEALLGYHILEDLGVPHRLLGTSTTQADAVSAGRSESYFYDLRVWLARRIGLVPLAVAAMAAVFWLCFRSLSAVVLPLMEVGACLAFVFGLMGWLGVPVYLTIAVMPVMLTSMGVVDEIHTFTHYLNALRDAPERPRREILDQIMGEMRRPVIMTAVTTAVGFASFMFSTLPPVRAFGLFTAIGVLFCMVWSLTVIPAMLACIPRERLLRRASDSGPTGQPRSAWAWLAGWLLRHRPAAAAVILLAAATAPFGVYRVQPQDSWIDGFDPHSDFHEATTYLNRHFQGGHLLQVCVEGDAVQIDERILPAALNDFRFELPAGLIDDPRRLIDGRLIISKPSATETAPARGLRLPTSWTSIVQTAAIENGKLVVTTPRTHGTPRFLLDGKSDSPLNIRIDVQPFLTAEGLRQVRELQRFIEGMPQYKVGGTLSAADFIETTRAMVWPNDPSRWPFPDDPQQIDSDWRRYRFARGEERLRQAVDREYDRSLMTIFLRDANFQDTGRLMAAIRDYERVHLAPQRVKLTFAGDVAVSQTLIDSIVSTEVQSVLFSLLGIGAITALIGRSWRWGVLCMLPSSLAVLIDFAVMGWVGMPLGVATSMFAAMTLGMGVDFAIHILERYRQARAGGMDSHGAVVQAMGSAGGSIWVNAVSIALGFGILVLSLVPSNARLGLLVVVGMVICWLSSIVLLPLMLGWAEGRQGGKAES